MKNIQEILDGMRTFLVNTDRHDGDMLDATEVHAALNQFADELDAWWKRENAEWKAAACACVSDAVISGKVAVEHVPVGNAAAMYDALVKIAHYCDDKDGMDDPYCADGHILSDMARAALSAPVRNCDRFNTVLEAAKAFAAEYQKQPHPCPDFIFSRWLFAPAAERKGEGDDKSSAPV